MTSNAMTAEKIRDLYQRRGKDFGTRAVAVNRDAIAEDGTIPVVMSSETPVLRYDWWTDTEYYEVLDHSKVDLSYTTKGMPFCVDHDTGERIGVVWSVSVDAKARTTVGNVQQNNNPEAAWRFQDIRDGFAPNVSIGYIRGDYTVEKQKGTEPETRRYAFMPIECSTVPIPADYEVGFGRSLLRALRTDAGSRPEHASPTGQESPMADKALEAPPEGGNMKRELEDELLRQASIREVAASHEIEPAIVLDWVSNPTMSLGDVKRAITVAIGERSKTATSGTRTAASPEIFVKSGEGPIGRDGNVKSGESGGFDSPGEFFRAIVGHARGKTDQRLVRGVALGQSEALQSDGGALLPAQFEQDLSGSKYAPGSIIDRVKHVTISSNTLNIAVVDETSRVDGSRSGAVTAGWVDEADSYTTLGKLKYRTHQFNTKKLVARARVTEEQVEDIPALTSMLPNEFRKEITFLQENGVVNGTGNGQMQGLITHAALVTQAIESGQTIANTPASIAANVSKMYSRMVPSLLSGAVWLMNIDLFPYLITATLGGTSAAMPIYLPPGGLSGSPYGSILGLPVVFTEYNAAVGTPGDMLLVNLGEYSLVEKSSGLGMTTSTHVYFDTGETAFRFMKRLDGNATWKSAITPFKGSNTKSFVVALATRS